MVNNYNEDLHQYTYRGKVVPSVTQIADPISFEKLNALDKLMLQHSAERGSMIHAYCQEFSNTMEYPEEIDEECRPYVDAFVQWYFDFDVKPLYTELAMFSEKFAGRCDLIAEINGKKVIIDLKTTSSINKKPLRVQMAGYSLLSYYGEAMNGNKLELNIDDTAVLHLKKDGTYEYKVVPPNFKWFETLYEHYRFMQEKEEVWKNIKAKNR